LGSGTDYLVEQNTRQLPGNLTYAHADSLKVSQDFGYDKDANLISVGDLVDHRRDKVYGYDALNRLSQAQAPNLWGTESYTYDPLNNIRQHALGTSVSLAQIDAANRQVGMIIGGSPVRTYAYDSRGNLISRIDNAANLTETRTFDLKNQLTDIPGVAHYDYDASGRRVKKTDAGGNATYYLYSGAGILLYQLDAAAATTTDYVYLGSKLLAEVKRGVGEMVLNPPGSLGFDANPNDGSFTVSWSAVGTASYELQESVNGGVTWSAVYSGTALSKAFSGKAGGAYLYRVRACQGECSDWHTSARLGVRPLLSTITVPSGIQGSSFMVNWTKPASTTAFDVEEQANGGAWQRIASDATGSSIARTGLANGSYAYRVSAKNAYGSRGWATSGAVTVLLPPSGAPALNVPSVSSTGGYTVSWTSVGGASSYTLQEQVNGGSWTAVYNGANPSQAFSGKTNGAHYGYRVQATNAGGYGPWSGTGTIAIAIPPPVPGNVVANDLVVNGKKESLTVVWSASSGATRYEVKRTDSGAVLYSGTDMSMLAQSGDFPLDLLSYAVRSCNAYACSTWVSAPVRHVLPPPASAPSLTAPSNSTGSYTVSWGTVANASSYTLQERVNGGGWTTAYSGSGSSKAYSGKAAGSYGYQVQACNATACGPWSGVWTVSVSTVGPVSGLSAKVVRDTVLTGPGRPSGQLAHSGTGTDEAIPNAPPPPKETYVWHVSATWTAASGATRYEVKVDSTLSSDSTTYGATGAQLPATKVSDSAIQVSVRACDANACSAWVGPVKPTVVIN